MSKPYLRCSKNQYGYYYQSEFLLKEYDHYSYALKDGKPELAELYLSDFVYIIN